MYLAAFTIPRGFKLHIIEETSVPNRADRITMVEVACGVAGCPFRLYFGKKTCTFNFILECGEFRAHNHELIIDKVEGKAALERLDFAPLDNKFHRPLCWDSFMKACEE